ncbi:Slp family lipoprotein [Aliiglaciecola sp. LCG003]|uniref:Slp family lipoprotein n=1 Tax=Aliiglaciecola sp. LCG003 TaxID=3053655 RepID=UPI002573A0E9|nr:Slp family lipoprotein [Aliiglaciecola sp. LCG003]WJG08208.1 Slp family lipoprotein [Aliiglaciecola sp. LCG003]
MQAKIAALFAVILLSGCVSVPESVQVDKNVELLSYEKASADPEGNLDKMARWGGVIAQIENLPDATMLEILHYPLRTYGRPIISDQSIGRFRVYVDGFLDPMVFQKGRAVTVAGKLIGVEEGTVGEHKYVFPTLQSTGYHLWKEIERVEVSTIHMWPYQSYWGFPYRPYHQRIIIRGGQRQTQGAALPVNNRPAKNINNRDIDSRKEP